MIFIAFFALTFIICLLRTFKDRKKNVLDNHTIKRSKVRLAKLCLKYPFKGNLNGEIFLELTLVTDGK